MSIYNIVDMYVYLYQRNLVHSPFNMDVFTGFNQPKNAKKKTVKIDVTPKNEGLSRKNGD